VEPLELLLSELMEHIDDLREPKEDGEDGGVWKDHVLSAPFKSVIT